MIVQLAHSVESGKSQQKSPVILVTHCTLLFLPVERDLALDEVDHDDGEEGQRHPDDVHVGQGHEGLVRSQDLDGGDNGSMRRGLDGLHSPPM